LFSDSLKPLRLIVELDSGLEVITDSIDSGAIKSRTIFAEGDVETCADADALVCFQIHLVSLSDNLGSLFPRSVVLVGTSIEDEVPLLRRLSLSSRSIFSVSLSFQNGRSGCAAFQDRCPEKVLSCFRCRQELCPIDRGSRETLM
jgi:hypothetical protein